MVSTLSEAYRELRTEQTIMILSRRPNEALVLGEHTVVTVARILPSAVRLAIENRIETSYKSLVLGLGHSRELASGVRITLVEIKSAKVRLGIEASRSVSVYRKEIWDALHLS
jgi:sRNA-binding carbon storage regulator CsrA